MTDGHPDVRVHPVEGRPAPDLMERCRTAAAGALRETREAWPTLSFYERFEQVICLILTFLIACLIAVATWHLVVHIIVLLLLDAIDPENQAVFQAVFGMVMTVLIALEFRHSILGMLERKRHIVQVQAVVLIALLALVRKFIIVDATKTEPMTLIGLAFAGLSLGGIYWLVREQDHREARDQVGQGPDSGHS
jgi:uncharacterized membrane protein (DUF373 family)